MSKPFVKCHVASNARLLIILCINMQHSRTVEEEIQGIEKILKQLEGKSGSGYEAWRRTQAVQKQKDNKVHVLIPPLLPLLHATPVLVCL